jgi:hypothetical protein
MKSLARARHEGINSLFLYKEIWYPGEMFSA